MAIVGHAFSRRVFAIPFEGGRFLRITAAAGFAYAVSTMVGGEGALAATGRAAALLTFPLAAWALGALHPDERQWLRRIFGVRG